MLKCSFSLEDKKIQVLPHLTEEKFEDVFESSIGTPEDFSQIADCYQRVKEVLKSQFEDCDV